MRSQLKLQQRHLREWDTLLVNQKGVLRLVKQKAAQKISVTDQDRRTYAELKNKQSARLIKLLKRQDKERQQLLNRQQEEKESLEQQLKDF